MCNGAFQMMQYFISVAWLRLKIYDQNEEPALICIEIYLQSLRHASPWSSELRLVCSMDVYFQQSWEVWAPLQNPLCAATPLRPRAKTMRVFIDEPHCYSRLHWGPFTDQVLQLRLALPPPWNSSLLWVALSLSLLTQKVFQRQFKEKHWEKHILLHNMKVNWDDRVVFSWV